MTKEKYITKTCIKHGSTAHVLEGRGYYRCKKCRVESIAKRRAKLKHLAIEYKGGKCEICEYNKCIAALEFHHLYGNDFGISDKGYTRSWETVKEELDKCQLLCSNCHREIHNNLV